MFIIIYLLFLTINGIFYFTSYLISDMLVISNNLDLDITNPCGAASDNSGNNNTQGNVNKTNSNTLDITASDGAIMTTALVAGSQLAKTLPSTAGKVGHTIGGVCLGGTAIVIKNVCGNISSQIGKNNLIDSGNSHPTLPPSLKGGREGGREGGEG
jgi:hypothetical protein